MDELPPEAQNVQRMLSALDRIRSERDNLRRDMDFINLENKFKVEALEKRLAQAQYTHVQGTHVAEEDRALQAIKLQNTQRGAFISILVAQHLQERCETYRSQAQALSIALKKSRDQSEEGEGAKNQTEERLLKLEEDNAALRESLASSQSQQAATELELLELRRKAGYADDMAQVADGHIARHQAENDSLKEKLETSESLVSELTTRVSSLEQDVARERTSHQRISATLTQAEQQVTELTQSIDNIESERDSLSLEITHLTQDLENSRHELDEAQTRYSALQAQQLSAMSSSEVTRALRSQIEDLEYRVLHRTEQVGIHQHDIKRLETNLRLQEERIAEMTSDLDVLQGEKAAMIEDCRTTREERDEALLRCEELEERVETVEEASSHMEERRGVEVQTMVELVIRGVATRRNISRQLGFSLSARAAQVSQMQARIHEADEFKTHALQHIEELSQEKGRLTQLVDEKKVQLESLQAEKHAALAQFEETSAALETARANLRELTSSLDGVKEQDVSVQAEIIHLQEQLQSKTDELSSLQSLHHDFSNEHEEVRASFTAQVADLERQICSLQETNAEMGSRREAVEKEVSRITEELKSYRSSGTENAMVQERLRSELEDLRASQLEETGDLRSEISQARVDLEDARRHQVDLEATYKLALDDLTQAKEDLEARLADATAKLQSSNGTQAELIELQDRYSSQTSDLHDNLDQVSRQLEGAERELKEQDVIHQETIRKLEEQLSDASDVLHAKEDLEMELNQLRTQHEAEINSLERHITSLTDEVKSARQSQSELESHCQELTQQKSDLEDQTSRMSSDVDQLQDQLKALSEKHDLALERHSSELKAAAGHEEQSQHAHAELVNEIISIRSQLQETETLVNTLQEEKQYIQADMTQLEAQIQRSLSMQRYQESQLKDSDHEISALKEQLEQARADYVESEKAAKAAEINLQLQGVQHEKTLSSLRREVNSLRENLKLEETVAELAERNSEMEQLLQAKCLEIEENDDRVIELLKEKKKLTSKVDSLTRKINTLQAKLVTDVTPKAGTHPQAQPLSGPGPAGPSIPPIVPAPSSRTPSTFHPPSTPNSRRIASGSSLSRPKTPEARVLPPPVFKARTPEAKRTTPKPHLQAQPQPPPPPQIITSSSSSSLGKKRRAPDDFEDCESLPPQGFTADSVPSHDPDNMNATTPRVRRALQAVRTGFTPVRSFPLQQTHTVLTSPARRATTGASLIADVTNSPRGPSLGADPSAAKAGKRGWLGKIRGGPGNAPRSVSSRPAVFERAQNLDGGSSR